MGPGRRAFPGICLFASLTLRAFGVRWCAQWVGEAAAKEIVADSVDALAHLGGERPGGQEALEAARRRGGRRWGCR